MVRMMLGCEGDEMLGWVIDMMMGVWMMCDDVMCDVLSNMLLLGWVMLRGG